MHVQSLKSKELKSTWINGLMLYQVFGHLQMAILYFTNQLSTASLKKAKFFANAWKLPIL